jgi:hypothetical protein
MTNPATPRHSPESLERHEKDFFMSFLCFVNFVNFVAATRLT